MATSTDRGTPLTRRGRPYRRARAAPASVGRVAWMLRVNRLLGAPEKWSRLSAFAAAFGAAPRGRRSRSGTVSEATISRWETGRVRASFWCVRRYEELLELVPGRLVATADTVYRYAGPAAAGAPALSRDATVVGERRTRLDALLDRALSSEPMSGWQWDTLTGLLSDLTHATIAPRRIWGELAQRLVEETVVADGLGWMQRYEAINRLLGHPDGEQFAAAACMSFAADPANQVFVEPISMLDACAHPDASRFVLGQLTEPLNDRTRYGALLACVRKVRDGHFTGEQLERLVPTVIELLGDPSSHADSRALGVALLRRLPNGVRDRAEPALRRALAGEPSLREVLAAGRLAARPTARLVVERVVATTLTTLDRDPRGFIDDLLPALVDELLYSPILDVRLYAGMLVRATPYRPALASALASELARRPVLADETLACSLLGGLRVLGGATQRRLVERLVAAPGLAPEIAAAAIGCLGHIGGVSSNQFWLRAIDTYAQGWRHHRDGHSSAALSGLVYAIGIARNHALLDQVRDAVEAPAPVRAAAAWWLARPSRTLSTAT